MLLLDCGDLGLMTDNSASTICPVCQNVNSAEAVKCLRCSVTLTFVGIGVEPSPEPAEVKVNAGAALGSACPHCGATSHAVGAIRCLWCKQLRAPGPELGVLDVVDEDEPSLTAKVCAVVLIVFARRRRARVHRWHTATVAREQLRSLWQAIRGI